MPSMYVSMTMELITCYECKLPFAVADWHLDSLRKTGQTFCCPNGHRQVFGNSEVERLRAEMNSLRLENTRLKNAEKAREKTAKEEAAKTKQEAKVQTPVTIEYKPTPRSEYVWSKEEKDKLIALRHDNPGLSWNEIGKRMGKTGPICSSMYNGMKSRGQVPARKVRLDDTAWNDIQKMLVAGDSRDVIAKKHDNTLDEINRFIEERLKAKKSAA